MTTTGTKGIAWKRKVEAREAEKRRIAGSVAMARYRRNPVPPPTEEEVARAMAEFRERGGTVKEVAAGDAGGSLVIGAPVPETGLGRS